MTSLWIILLLAALGIINALYLTKHAISGEPVKCIGFPDAWCKKVQYSKWSKTFGIPNPYLGLLMYTIVFVGGLLSVGGLLDFAWVAIIITLGFVFSLYFLIIQAFVLKAYCTWCVVSIIDFTLMFWLLAFVAF